MRASKLLPVLRSLGKSSGKYTTLQRFISTAPRSSGSPTLFVDTKIYRTTLIHYRNMSSTGLDEKVTALIEKSYPQAKDAGSDPVKLSQAVYPSAEVSTRANPFHDHGILTHLPVLDQREDRDRTMADHLVPHRLAHRGRRQDCRTSQHTEHTPLGSHNTARRKAKRG